jgi:hypothetical protein
MRVILLCAGTSGAARKVHRRMRVDLRCTRETGAEDRNHRRMCVDGPSTAGAAAGESDAGARAGGDGRCYGRFRDLCDCTGDLRFNFSNQTGSCLIVPRVAMAGLRAPGCDQIESGWRNSRGGPKARVPDFGGVKGCHPPSHHPHPPQRPGFQILVV